MHVMTGIGHWQSNENLITLISTLLLTIGWQLDVLIDGGLSHMAEFNHVLQDQPGLIVIRGDRGNAKTLNYHLVNADAYGPCTEGSKGV